MDTNMYNLIHDVVGSANSIKTVIQMIKDGKVSEEEKLKVYNAIIERTDKINSAIDVFYISQTKL